MALGISVIGATGRMGKKVLEQTSINPEFKLVGGCASQHSSHAGKDLGELISMGSFGILLSTDKASIIKDADVAIDFSLHHATVENVHTALKHLKPIVIGSTGHGPEQKRAIEAASQYIPILFSPNFSLGMGLCLRTARFLSRHLKGQCHIDIIEIHHDKKKDIPSGSALALAQALEYGHVCQDTTIQSPRPKETVVIHSLRSGNTIGEHTIIFNLEAERIELKHQVFSRDAFAQGALKAAKFLIRQRPGLYSYEEVFVSDTI